MDGSNPITGRLFQVPPLISSSNSCSAGSSSSNINTAWFQVSFGDTIGTQDHGAKYNRTVLAVFENYFNWSHMSFPLGRVKSSFCCCQFSGTKTKSKRYLFSKINQLK
jgi:hypothetical protein